MLRLHTDLDLPTLFLKLDVQPPPTLSRNAQSAVAALLVVLACVPHLPGVHEALCGSLSWPLGLGALLLQVLFCTALVRLVLGSVFDFGRFRYGQSDCFGNGGKSD